MNRHAAALGKLGGQARGGHKAVAARVNGGISYLTFSREHYWPTVAPTLAETTRRSSKWVIDALENDFGHTPLRDLTPQGVEAWWARVRASGRAGRTCNIMLIRLRHLCRTAVRWGYLGADPSAECKRATENLNRVRFFASPEERVRVFEAANPTLRDFVSVAHYTGARRRSVWGLCVKDVDLERYTVRFRSPKGAQFDHVLPVHPILAEVLTRRASGKGPDERLFPEYTDPKSVSRAWTRLCHRLGLKDFRLHDLRHDTASAVVMATGSLKAAQEILGHRTPSMTNRYAHLADGYLREVITRAL